MFDSTSKCVSLWQLLDCFKWLKVVMERAVAMLSTMGGIGKRVTNPPTRRGNVPCALVHALRLINIPVGFQSQLVNIRKRNVFGSITYIWVGVGGGDVSSVSVSIDLNHVPVNS